MSFDELRDKVLKYNSNANIELIKKAYDFSKAAHDGVKRQSGEDYFDHPLSVALTLSDSHAVSETIAAALLHDVVEDTKYTIEDIKKEFGKEVATLVEGVTKINKINFKNREDYNDENLRKILLATAKDYRVMLIKLADRLHNMRTISAFKEEKKIRIANETMQIYAPIAHKLGMWNIKGELEDLALRYLDPEAYYMLRTQINEKRTEREKKTEDIIAQIEFELKEHNFDVKVYGRAKYFYSIYKKMKRKNLEFNKIYDLIAIRIITETIPECYAVLGVIHDMWKPLPKRFKDYIATPKSNGYQSLHTAVIGDHGKILEIQIKTEQMHTLAEYGVAAHWKYKGGEKDAKFDRKIQWLKQILEWRQDSPDAKDFIETFKVDVFEKEIVVFTPKGDPISLPEGATPVDFAYMVHSKIGDKCSKSIVNTKLVPLYTKLESGDIVDIITVKNAKPSRDWLKFIKTSKARSKIRKSLDIAGFKSGKSKEDDIEEDSSKYIDTGFRKEPVKVSKCCSPKPFDEIIASLTKDKKITVHKKDCPNSATLDMTKVVPVTWTAAKKGEEVLLRIVAQDKVGTLVDILKEITKYKVNIAQVNSDTSKERVILKIGFKVPGGNLKIVDKMISDLKELDHVDNVDIVKE